MTARWMAEIFYNDNRVTETVAFEELFELHDIIERSFELERAGPVKNMIERERPDLATLLKLVGVMLATAYLASAVLQLMGVKQITGEEPISG